MVCFVRLIDIYRTASLDLMSIFYCRTNVLARIIEAIIRWCSGPTTQILIGSVALTGNLLSPVPFRVLTIPEGMGLSRRFLWIEAMSEAYRKADEAIAAQLAAEAQAKAKKQGKAGNNRRVDKESEEDRGHRESKGKRRGLYDSWEESTSRITKLTGR